MSTRVTLVNGTGTELGTAVDPLNVEGTLTTTISTIDTVTNLVQQGGIAISLNTGVRDTGTQRVTIATDDVVPVTFTGSTDVATQTTLASALTSLQTLDNAISGAVFNITQIGGAAAPIGAGLEATAVRVTLPTDGTGVVKLGAGTAEIGKLAAGLANIGDVDVLTIAAGDNNIGNVDIASIAAGDNNIGNVDIVSGTITTVSTLTGGGIAHDSADSGNPVKVGAKAFSPDGTTPGAVAENDRSDLKTDLNGRLLVNIVSPQRGHKHLDGTTAYTDEALVADPGDGFQIIITNITFSSGEAVAINFFLEESATKIFGPIYIEAVAGRGYVSGPIHLPVTASTAVTLTTSAANDQSFDMDYFIQAV